MTQPESEAKPAHAVKDNHHVKQSDRKERAPTKVIIRRLPPTLDQETFLNQVSPVPDYDYIYSVKGDMSLGENSFSRVYINFVNPDDVFAFKEKFDNYVFLDNKGHEYPAVVEFASFQKIPKKRAKGRIDTKCGTIETDPIYLEFLESLKVQPNQDEKPEFSYQLMTENKNDRTTPLLEYIKQKRIERQRIREEKREERKKREMERKKIRDDERKKRYEDRSPVKTVVIKANYGKQAADEKEPELSFKDTNITDETKEKPVSSSSHYKLKDRKYDDKKFVYNKTKYPSRTDKRDYLDKKSEYKGKRDDFKERDYKSKHYEENKKEPEPKFPKRVKKYSERREERKMEALKAEQKTIVEQQNDIETKVDDHDAEAAACNENIEVQLELNTEQYNRSSGDEKQDKEDSSKEDGGFRNKDGDSRCGGKGDPRVQRRIRNKDRPTMALYQPGMLSKRKQVDGGDSDSKDSNVNKE